MSNFTLLNVSSNQTSYYDNTTIDEPQVYHEYEYDGDETLYLTRGAQIVTSVSGSISIASSSLIMYIILRSERKLSSPYHIIMFCMSFWDIIASAAVGLATIPMPKDVIYPFEGSVYGTTTSCTVQGFVFVMAVSFTLCCNISLNIFYLCTIRYGMSEEKVKKLLLPLFLVCSIALSLPTPLNVQKRNMFNPSPGDAYCSIYEYPIGCYDEKDDENVCIRGEKSCSEYVHKVGAIAFGSALSILLLTMAMIVRTVYLLERVSAARSRASHAGSGSNSDAAELISEDRPPSNDAQQEEDNISLTRTILLQALLYVGAFFLCWVPTLFATILPLPYYGDLMRLIFQPLQGFFSAIIFVYHKAHNIYRSDDVTMLEAMWKVIKTPARAPEIMIARVSMVVEDEFNDRRMPVETFWGTRVIHEQDVSTPACDDEEYVMKTSSNDGNAGNAGNNENDANSDDDNDPFPVRFDDLFASSPNFRGKLSSRKLLSDTKGDQEISKDAEDNISPTSLALIQASPVNAPGDPAVYIPANHGADSPADTPASPQADDASDDSTTITGQGLRGQSALQSSSINSDWSTDINRRSSLDMAGRMANSSQSSQKSLPLRRCSAVAATVLRGSTV